MRTAVARLQSRLGATTVYVTHDQTEAMTLGHRVAVMRSGVLQQVGTPRELYDRPGNVFVAGFIGSPAMNFLPGAVEGDVVRTPLGALPLDAGLRRALEKRGGGSGSSSEVLVGIRPEDLDDATLSDGDGSRWTFEVPVDVVESMGSDLYVHFDAGGDDLHAPGLRELAEESGTTEVPHAGASGRAIARIDPSSPITTGTRARLSVNPGRIHLFNPVDGTTLASPA
jgi:multiple sugar transport system ATP-binding protein